MSAKLRFFAAILVTGWACINTILLSHLMRPDRFQRSFERIVKRWADRMLRVLGVRVRVVGRPPDIAPVVFISNHQSLLDIPSTLSIFPHVKIIAKTELFRIPLFGRAMRRAGILEIDRGDRNRAFRTIDEAAKRVRQGTTILVYAEGTRSRDTRIQPFKKGAFVLASKADVPVVPLAIRGTAERLPKGGREVVPGEVRLAIGAPIPPLGPSGRNELLARAETAVRALYEQIC
ncbi:MAG: 1-acyl-sn-glycerol-3-phosphate acyltransferase [Gemmatimonadetes bacterium]|nr:1-acyl-sn-glycerol-3-phosphate acyltransferase [Gemmatimonadota bacterium]